MTEHFLAVQNKKGRMNYFLQGKAYQQNCQNNFINSDKNKYGANKLKDWIITH